jgi:hypothetical protein
VRDYVEGKGYLVEPEDVGVTAFYYPHGVGLGVADLELVGLGLDL